MKFTSIPGLLETKRLLITSIREQHMAHAQLFAGPPGALGLPLALAFASYLHCENKGADACGTCPACSKSLKHIHPDTHFVFPVGNIKESKKDEEQVKTEIRKLWRAFLLEQPFGTLDDWSLYSGGEDKQAIISREESREIVKSLTLKPFESRYKVMIIWHPELMHPSAANGILKVLEEPPPQTYFILVTHAADTLLPTIVSRTQVIAVPLIGDQDITAYLKDQQAADDKHAARAAQLAEGNLNRALRLLGNEQDRYTTIFIGWMRACYKHNYAGLVSLAEEYHQLDRLNQKNLLHYSLNMMRETLLEISGTEQLHRVQGEELTFIRNFSKEMDIKKIEKSVKLINDAGYFLDRNGSAKMVFLDLSLQLSKTIKPA